MRGKGFYYEFELLPERKKLGYGSPGSIFAYLVDTRQSIKSKNCLLQLRRITDEDAQIDF
jgi:hypothetical protein